MRSSKVCTLVRLPAPSGGVRLSRASWTRCASSACAGEDEVEADAGVAVDERHHPLDAALERRERLLGHALGTLLHPDHPSELLDVPVDVGGVDAFESGCADVHLFPPCRLPDSA